MEITSASAFPTAWLELIPHSERFDEELAWMSVCGKAGRRELELGRRDSWRGARFADLGRMVPSYAL
jgi:hypothetical protein